MTELSFKGKEFVYNHHLSVPFRPLVPDACKGIGEVALDGNLIIHGDNLEALKSLLPLYAAKVDCIFIDPPYNTGNEGWCYNDNVNSPLIKEWLKENFDPETGKRRGIAKEDGLRHDKWCAMMWPRLRLLHDLLSEDGSIWITLDDNEVHRARGMLDEIFGEQNFLGTLIWEKSDSPRMDALTFSSSNDFIVVYAKNIEHTIFNKIDIEAEPLDHYNQIDESGRSYYLKPLRAMGGQGDSREARPNLFFALVSPDGAEVFPKRQDGTDGAWRWSKNKIEKEKSRIEWRQGRIGWTPYFRIYADTSAGRPPETIWRHNEVGSSRTSKNQIKQIFGDAPFDTPKPVGIIERILEISSNPDSIVLDSFAGSGTTAHAVLQANRRDGGNRKFILVECEDYADTLTAERVRRVIRGYPFKGTQKTELLRESLNWRALENADRLRDKVKAIETLHGHEYDRITKQVKDAELIVTGEKVADEKAEGLGGSFTYCTLGPALELDKVLTGETLPAYEALGAALYHMATNRAFSPAKMREADHYLGSVEGQHLWLIYQPDLEWLKSPEAALTLSRAKAFAETDKDAKHLVFAPSRFVSQKVLKEAGLPVEFVPLPFALYRLERE